MRTVGVDLAAEPTRTALAAIEWGADTARVAELRLGIHDADIVDLSVDATSIGIDCAFGWPVEFVEFVTAHAGRATGARTHSGIDLRRRLAYRNTDRVVRERTGRWPLSVSTDRLGMTAIHCAELLEAFESTGEEVDRSGGGRFAEVYPAAALRAWGLLTPGYKTKPEARVLAAAALLDALPWLETTDEQRLLLGRSDDALDALAASLNARAHALGKTLPVAPDLLDAAKVEGWVALPTCSIAELAPHT
ncbi:DUF429 domain-containing protein [Pseudoclavibacter sp. RFBJ3]|uniref:DUF429 domain-containing protein n=1 Tax=unclassified Pseudoclavibacter TaxID=2615177 RepID=UPI000CE7CAE0|nr:MULTISPECIES: DUF429 domain-containing protein [unclassified Pseudoclavibacter]PPF79912.1 DUF429 domain-containing protein [Pseudoclavibacter sp. RFBJ5]PPF88977.1 DUF429 domain-containing protein [Pseudoclavibacter sp. RFBJ3]PPG00531.1 DUF429 domain-containing protein [Pseudoclavibacter sp. RFBH5]PPG18312.1 DUF429 domain-containing protein [Pseudoclavibacter sp. RFBI4]